MTIYEDGAEKETVKLYELRTKEQIHALFQEKGFRKKNQEAVAEDRRIRVVDKQIAKEEQLKPMFDKVFMVYGFIGLVAASFAIVFRRGRKQRRPAGSLPVRV